MSTPPGDNRPQAGDGVWVTGRVPHRLWISLGTSAATSAAPDRVTGRDGIHRVWMHKSSEKVGTSVDEAPQDDGIRREEPPPARPGRATDRQILALAVPAFGALVAEPLFLLADSAIVGRLGTVELAGLGVAGAILASAVNLFVFLAYGTTATAARRMGAGDRAGAFTLGVDALWLAAGIGLVTGVTGWLAAGSLVRVFGAGSEVADAAVAYLRWSMPGLPAMLVVLAATGLLRGLQDTRTPLMVAAGGAVVNVVLNLVLVHGVHLGIAGSAMGTSLTQLGMAAVVVAVVVRGARREGARLAPHATGIGASARTGMPLLVRTLTLRAVLLLATAVAARQGAVPLAAHQVASTVWTLLSLALDALAIAGQALTGKALGAGDVRGAREATQRMVRWGVLGGAVLGVLLLAGRGLLAPLFTEDPQVRRALVAALAVAAVMQPLAGYVFVLDGVLIGAGDGRYLAVAGVMQLVAFAPLALAVGRFGPDGTAGLVLLWFAFAGGWMAARALLLGWRAHGDAWLVTGATR